MKKTVAARFLRSFLYLSVSFFAAVHLPIANAAVPAKAVETLTEALLRLAQHGDDTQIIETLARLGLKAEDQKAGAQSMHLLLRELLGNGKASEASLKKAFAEDEALSAFVRSPKKLAEMTEVDIRNFWLASGRLAKNKLRAHFCFICADDDLARLGVGRVSTPAYREVLARAPKDPSTLRRVNVSLATELGFSGAEKVAEIDAPYLHFALKKMDAGLKASKVGAQLSSEEKLALSLKNFLITKDNKEIASTDFYKVLDATYTDPKKGQQRMEFLASLLDEISRDPTLTLAERITAFRSTLENAALKADAGKPGEVSHMVKELFKKGCFTRKSI